MPESVEIPRKDGGTCVCTGAMGLRLMLWKLTGQSPHDEGCPRWQVTVEDVERED